MTALLPAFVFVALSGPLVPRLRASKNAGVFLDGVNVASLALMAVVTVQLGRAALVDVPTVLLGAVAARVLARFKPNSTWLVLGSAGAGLRSIVLARSESDVLGYLRARDRQDRPRASLVRRLPAPREREPGCLAVRALAEARADSPRELAEAWVLLHDRVAVALWAATFHVEHTTLDAARGKASLLSLPEEATKSALLRRAAVRPADVLGAGLVAALVVDGEQARVDRARAAVAFGDASVATMRAHLAAVRSPGAAR